jgi:hypothetical protein
MTKLTTTGTLALKTPLSKWYTTWSTQRAWRYHINDNENTISHTSADGQTTLYALQRRTTNSAHTYHLLLNQTPSMFPFRRPVTPSHINQSTIVITRPTHGHPTFPTTTSSTIRTYNTTTSYTTEIPERTTTTNIGLYTLHSYEYQKFSWVITDHNQQVVKYGPAQHIQSCSCDTIRGGLIGLLQAISHILGSHTEQGNSDSQHSFKYYLQRLQTDKETPTR